MTARNMPKMSQILPKKVTQFSTKISQVVESLMI